MDKMIRVGTLISGDTALKVMPKIIDYGFESFSITFGQTTGDVNLPELAKRLKDIIAKRDIIISTVSIFGNPLTNNDTVANWERIIDSGNLFGTDLVTGFAGRLTDKPINESIPKFKEVFGKLAKRASDKGIRIAFENCDMGGDWNRGDWNIAQNPTVWEMMFDAVPMNNLGLEWEPCHQMVSLIDPIPQLRKWAKRIFHIHGKDATVAWDVIQEYGVRGQKQYAWHRTPGFGDSNWHDIITILMQNDYKGTIDIEGYHDPVYRGELELVGQLKALKYLKDCRGGEEFIPSPF